MASGQWTVGAEATLCPSVCWSVCEPEALVRELESLVCESLSQMRVCVSLRHRCYLSHLWEPQPTVRAGWCGLMYLSVELEGCCTELLSC